MKKPVLVIVLLGALGAGVLMGAVKDKLKEPPKVVATVATAAPTEPVTEAPKGTPDWCPRLIFATFTTYKAFIEGHTTVSAQALAQELFKEFNSQVVAETAYYAYTNGWDKDQLVKHIEGNCVKFGKPAAKR